MNIIDKQKELMYYSVLMIFGWVHGWEVDLAEVAVLMMAVMAVQVVYAL
jgi:hypothetical protein